MMDLTGYELETLRDSGEFVLSRARQFGNPVPVLVLVAERPTSASLERLEHEYTLAADLDPKWAARPLALARHNGNAALVLDAAGNVRLTGFGIASRLTRERQAPAPPEVIAGTLAYMAPEQTGRMNRSIDSRSDLYSLGVTL